MRAVLRRRRGATLLELLISLGLAAIVGAVLLGVLLAQLRLARHTARRASATDGVRTTTAIIGGEIRRAAPQDVRVIAAESLGVRAFRGIGILCGSGAGTVRVRYRGDRMPDPRKDSVLTVDAGVAAADALIDSRAAASCVPRPGEVVLEWRLTRAPAPGAVLLLYEPGTYYLSARALRYRLGGEGRQPITAEVFAQAQTAFGTVTGGGVQLQLATGVLPPVAVHTFFTPPLH